MYIIITQNPKLLELAEKENEQIIAINSFEYKATNQVAMEALSNTSDSFIKNRINDLLISLGIPMHLTGFNCLSYAILYMLTCQSNNHIRFTKEVYPAVAAQFNLTAHAVDRNISTVIKHIDKETCSDALDSIFGTQKAKDNLTNTSFVCGIVNYLKKEFKL